MAMRGKLTMAWTLGIALACAVSAGSAEGPDAPVLVDPDDTATVLAAGPDGLVVEDAQGTYTVVSDAHTVVRQGNARIALGDIEIGQRVVIEPRAEPPDGRAGRTITAAQILVVLEVVQ
jgi:hypothetical protein